MSPYEITMPGGSVEHWNEEPGQAWLERLLGHFPKAVWLNPVPQPHWGYTHSIGLIRNCFETACIRSIWKGSIRACGNWCGSHRFADDDARYETP